MKKQGEYMPKWENIEIPVWVFGHPQYFVKPAYDLGVGFMGMSAGWTSHTHAVPVCHPNEDWS